MSNLITVQISFSYRGETWQPAIELDLDTLLADTGRFPDLHDLLAGIAQIDTYSYLYEVMRAHELEFRDASGLAADFLHDGRFDINGFQQVWRAQQVQQSLGRLAYAHLGVEDLTARPDLLQALQAAWQLGRESRDETPDQTTL